MSFGINLPSISKVNLPRLEAGFSFCAKVGASFARVNVDLADATGKALDLMAVKTTKELADFYGVSLHLTTIAQVPNSQFWRTELVASGAYPNDQKAYAGWKRREDSGQPMDWRCPKGVHPSLWPSLVNVFSLFTSILLPDCVMLENEVGNTLDHRRKLWGDKPIGYVSEDCKAYLERLANRLRNDIDQFDDLAHTCIGTPALEADTFETAGNQWAHGYGPHMLKCDALALNWYATAGDCKPTEWALRVADGVSAATRKWNTKLPVLLSELNAHGKLGIEYLEAARDVLGKNELAFCWHDYDSKEWGLF